MHFDGQKRPKKKKLCLSNKRQLIFFCLSSWKGHKKKKCMSHEKKKIRKMLVTWNCHLQVSRLNLRWNLNPSRQIEVLTQLKISIWLIRAFIFNASKLFNSKHYPYDNDDMSLDKLIMKFTILNVKNALCKVELFEFIETLRCKCDNKWWNLAPHILTKALSNKKGKQGTKWKDPHPRRQMNHPRRWTTRGTSSSWTPSNGEKSIWNKENSREDSLKG